MNHVKRRLQRHFALLPVAYRWSVRNARAVFAEMTRSAALVQRQIPVAESRRSRAYIPRYVASVPARSLPHCVFVGRQEYAVVGRDGVFLCGGTNDFAPPHSMLHFTEPFAQSTRRSVLSADKIRRLQNIFAACGDRLKI